MRAHRRPLQMPALMLRGQPWSFASDEILCIAAPFVLLRAAGVTLIVRAMQPLLVYTYTCPPGLSQLQQLWSIGHQCPIERLLGYAIVAGCLQLCIIALELIGAAVACRGSIMDQRSRRCIKPLLFLHGLTLVAEVPAAAIGMNFAYSSSNFAYEASGASTDVDHCASCLVATSDSGSGDIDTALDELYDALESGASALKLVTVVQAVITCLTFFKLRGLCPRPGLNTSRKGWFDWWRSKLRAFDWLLDVESDAFEGHFVLLSRLTHEYLKGLTTVDFTRMDVAAGLILIGQSQRHELLHPIDSPRSYRPKMDHLNGSSVRLSGCESQDDEDIAPLMGELERPFARSSVHLAFDGLPAASERIDSIPAVAADGGQPLPGTSSACKLTQATAIAELQHCFRYAFGSYGWMLNAYVHGDPAFMCAPVALLKLAPCCPCSRSLHQDASCCGRRHLDSVGYNPAEDCCGCSQAALLQTLNFPEAATSRTEGPEACQQPQVVYSSWENTTLLKPFSITIDPVMRAVVIAVRGSLSIDDAITDALAGEQNLSGTFEDMLGRAFRSESGLGHLRLPEYKSASSDASECEASLRSDPEYVAHQGILRSALTILEHCDAHFALQELMTMRDGDATMEAAGASTGEADGKLSFLQQLAERARLCGGASMCSDYRLITTGHSLGAGVAQMLAMLLRAQFAASTNSPSLQNVSHRIHCYAYSPPGGIMSISAAEKTRDFITNFVVGDDMISRLSVRTMQQLRDHALELLCYTPANKNSIFGAACYRGLRCSTACRCSSAKSLTKRPAWQAKHLISTDLEQLHNVSSDSVVETQQGGSDWIAKRQQLIAEGKLQYSRRMFIAGTTLHATPRVADDSTYTVNGCCVRHKAFDAAWVQDCNSFQEIRVSSDMLIHHFPDRVAMALESVASSGAPVPLSSCRAACCGYGRRISYSVILDQRSRNIVAPVVADEESLETETVGVHGFTYSV